ncbi:hypothetical protein ROSINTL182_05112 [Roseburia intestinalis L1-82]|uniref:Uncharacterized protein n=1 Tax=Roseburia intestinalis L1-82 TaxID=536231 RepID=C7G5F4_9FIRM|nr:hypothetical protein ROSINTL182_05112 [Roseburia intestinalis L1-82]
MRIENWDSSFSAIPKCYTDLIKATSEMTVFMRFEYKGICMKRYG